MAQDAVDDARVGNERCGAHASAAGAGERVSFEDFPINRAQVLQASLEKSELSRSSAGPPGSALFSGASA